MRTPVHVDLWYSATWNEITTDVRSTPEHQITISGGQQNWLTRVSPTKCDLSLINTIIHPGDDPSKIGKYSPRNPVSPLYGLIGRNTPLRVYIRWLLDGFDRTVASGWGTSASHLDSSNQTTAIVGSQAWTTTGSGTGSAAVGSGVATHTQTTDGGFRLSYLASGANIRDCEIRCVVTADEANIDGGNIEPGNLVLRLQDSSNYYHARVQVTTGELVQIGIRKVVAGSGSEVAAPVTVEGLTYTGQQLAVAFLADGPHLAAKVWDPAVGEAFGWQVTATDTSLPVRGAPGVRSGVASGNTDVPVTFTYDSFEVRSYRFTGEVEAWPQEWTLDADEDGNGVLWAPLVAYGLMYRLGLPGQDVLAKSALARWYDEAISARVGRTVLPTYLWPLEDPSGATAAQSGLGGASLPFVGPSESGDPRCPPGAVSAMRAVGGFASASSGAGRGGHVTSSVTLSGTELVVDCWVAVDTSGSVVEASDAIEVRPFNLFQASAPVGIVLLIISSETDQFFVSMASTGGSDLATFTDATRVATAFDGRSHHYRVVLETSGSDVDVTLLMDDETVGTDTFTATTVPTFDVAGTIVFPEMARRKAAGVASEDIPVTMSFLAISDDATIPSPYEAGTGHAGETADARVARVCAEEGIQAFVFGTGIAMGAQPVAPPLELFIGSGEATHVDAGPFFERRHTLGFSFTAYGSLLNQDPTLTLDYASQEVAPPLLHREDLDHCQNDVIVTRRGGASSARLVQETGPLNVSAPHTDPNGVGHYPVRPELNLASDSQVDDIAARLRWHGTTDGLRFAALGVDLTALYHAAKTGLIGDTLAVDPGDKVRVENIPTWLGAGDTEQIHRGFTELIGPFHWVIEHVTSPGNPFDVGEYQDTTASGDVPRYDTEWSVTSDGLWLPGTSGAYASTTDHADLDLTGDLSLRARIRLRDYTNGAIQHLVGKWTTVSDQRSYRLRLSATGELVLEWSTDGTAAGIVDEHMSPTLASLVADGDIISVRADLDADNGAGGYTVTFYTSTDEDPDTGWTLQDTNTAAGATSVFSGSAAATVGANPSGTETATGIVVWARITGPSGGGAIRANPDFAAQAAGTTSFADSAGKTWTVNGTAAIVGDDLTGTSTLLVVETSVPPLWTVDPPGGWPILIRVEGAILSVTGISGSSSPQQFTISTTVPNGIVKTIPSGSPVRVARPAYYGFEG